MTDEKTYLEHILDAIDKVNAYTADGRDAFMTDTKTQDAVVRHLPGYQTALTTDFSLSNPPEGP